jgi:hypothetical protein
MSNDCNCFPITTTGNNIDYFKNNNIIEGTHHAEILLLIIKDIGKTFNIFRQLPRNSAMCLTFLSHLWLSSYSYWPSRQRMQTINDVYFLSGIIHEPVER